MLMHTGLLDYSSLPCHDLYVFTGNAFVRRDGALVMGRGAAREVRDTHPWVPYALGNIIANRPRYGFMEVHHVINRYAKDCIGIFQVKEHFKDAADLDLIRLSCDEMLNWHDGLPADRRFSMKVHMNCPGVGNGRLPDEAVMPLMEQMPDWLHLYR
jgi:hypothetical protein